MHMGLRWERSVGKIQSAPVYLGWRGAGRTGGAETAAPPVRSMPQLHFHAQGRSLAAAFDYNLAVNRSHKLLNVADDAYELA